MTVRFGTDGLRGQAGRSPIDTDTAWRIGLAAGTQAARVVVGRDTRPSGEALANAVVEGILAAGSTAVDAGIVPTSAVQLAVPGGGTALGIMVTASHNPAQDNGFKVLLPDGLKPDDDAAGRWSEAIAAARPGSIRGTRVAGHDAVVAGWLSALCAQVGPWPGHGVGLDLAHGAVTPHGDALVATFPGLAVVSGAGDGVINDRAGSEHVDGLRGEVLTRGLDAGLAVDGDGDRCVLVDGSGEVVPGDALLGALATVTGARALVVTVMSTIRLEAALPGVLIVRTPVGDRFVRAAMEASGLPLGGESSGHVLFSGFRAGDGLAAGLTLLARLGRGDLAERTRPFAPWPSVSASIRRPADRPLDRDALAARVARIEADLPDGRVLVRPSGTEPVIRVLVEGPDHGRVRELAQRLVVDLTAWLA